jgi:hypothetical protein
MTIENIELNVALLKDEMAKFEAGNKVAGTRARKVLQAIKKAAQEFRNEIQAKRKGVVA